MNSSPAIADVDGDDKLEVIIGSDNEKVHCLNGITGIPEWIYSAPGDVHRGIAVCDLDMDDKLEVLVPNVGHSLICLNGEDGSELWVKYLAWDVHDPVVGDIDMDGCVEIIVGTQDVGAVWALDDVGNQSGCGSYLDVEERDYRLQVTGCRLQVIGKGVYLFTPNAISVDIKLYDVCGRLQQTIYKGVLTKGGHTFIPNIRNSGVYFAVLYTHRLRQSLKIIRF